MGQCAERGAEGHMQSLQTLEKLISVISSKGDYYNVLTDMTAMLKGAYGDRKLPKGHPSARVMTHFWGCHHATRAGTYGPVYWPSRHCRGLPQWPT